ncbi:MAG: hypothetical protein JWR21_3200 [Herminiimonas sp.]|nr:hypothetical protein [Herminiimonas sp.]MDB5854728.1 hypothetical protein [Herminiimonas sp.]
MQTVARLVAATSAFLADESGLSMMEAALVGLLVAVICILALLALSRPP